MAIRRPGVEITQEFVSESPTVVTPSLFPVIVGPCWQIVDAFDDDGETQTEAYAGTYQDGNGTVSYDLPGLTEDADVDEDEIRVFLLLGDDSTELSGESDEDEIVEGSATSTYTWDGSASTATFEDSTTPGTFISSGVEVGDYLRLSFQGETYDLAVTVVDSESTITVSAGIEDTSVEVSAYSIVRDPAQFVYKSSAEEANVIVGDETDYFTFSTLSTGDYAGQAGDGLTLVIQEGTADDSGTDGVSGSSLFYDTTVTAGFLTELGLSEAGAVSDTYLWFDRDSAGTGQGESLTEVTHVITNTSLALEADGHTAGTTGAEWTLGTVQGTADTAWDLPAADAWDDSDNEFTHTGADFTDIQTGIDAGETYFIELTSSGDDGVYRITAAAGAVLTLDSTKRPSGDIAAATGTYTIIKSVTTDPSSAGALGATTEFSAASMSISSGAQSDLTSYYLDIDGTGYLAASLVTGTNILTIADTSASGAGHTWSLAIASQALEIEFDADEATVTISLPRDATGVSPVEGSDDLTFAALETALTDDSDASYDAETAAVITGADAGSSGELHTGHIGSYTFDGGVDADGVLLDEDLLGSTTPIGKIYISYKALRLDVSDQADDASVLKFSSTTDLETDLGPISTDNPLALGIYYALLNCPGREVKAIGVSAVSTAQSDGTTSAYTSALEFLEGEDVYAMVPLTQDPEIHALFDSHVETMSEPENKHERICFFSKSLPEYSAATLLASGTQGNTEDDFISDSTADDYGLFSTSVDLGNTSELADALSAGETVVLVVSSTSSNTASDTQAYGTSVDKYGLLVDSVSSDNFVLTLDSASLVASAALDDGTDWDGLVDVAWAIYSVGSAITSASDQAERVAGFGEVYENRRTFVTWPSDLSASLSGSDVLLTGEYLAAAWAGKVGKEKVQQGFTNTAVTGFSTIKYSNGYFTESQLDDIAGGGTFITYQNSESAPLKCRHQLSTDVSSVQRRELSVTKIIDYVAKQFRNSLSGKIGVNNLTQSFLDALSTQIQGLLGSLTDQGVLTGGSLTDLSIDEDAPDTLNITLLITVPFPCNYIALTLQI